MWVKTVAMLPLAVPMATEYQYLNIGVVPEPISHINRQLDFAVGCLQYGIGNVMRHSCHGGVIMAAYLPPCIHFAPSPDISCILASCSLVRSWKNFVHTVFPCPS